MARAAVVEGRHPLTPQRPVAALFVQRVRHHPEYAGAGPQGLGVELADAFGALGRQRLVRGLAIEAARLGFQQVFGRRIGQDIAVGGEVAHG